VIIFIQALTKLSPFRWEVIGVLSGVGQNCLAKYILWWLLMPYRWDSYVIYMHVKPSMRSCQSCFLYFGTPSKHPTGFAPRHIGNKRDTFWEHKQWLHVKCYQEICTTFIVLSNQADIFFSKIGFKLCDISHASM
jgi:hypothetical protein